MQRLPHQERRRKMSWVHGLVAGDPMADSKACLTCHRMPDTAFNAHGASADVLKQSTTRLAKIASQASAPRSARAQDVAFPTHDMVAAGLTCATCHQEHQGASFDLSKITNEQCRSCHVVKFDSFDRDHPKFESYPFKRRTRIVYDHAGHFGKHYPEVAKKDPARKFLTRALPATTAAGTGRSWPSRPFDQTCSGCHLNQIVGTERASGPKGIAFLSVPGLDVQTLKQKKAAIGEWPDASEAELTPFMKAMIGRDERGRALIKALDGVNLQDLAQANDEQIKAVTALAWKTKRLFHALIKGKASDVLGTFNIGGGATLSPNLVADLTASIPRDVVVSAQQQWLPNLAAEMASRPDESAEKDGWSTITTRNEAGGNGCSRGIVWSACCRYARTKHASPRILALKATRPIARAPDCCRAARRAPSTPSAIKTQTTVSRKGRNRTMTTPSPIAPLRPATTEAKSPAGSGGATNAASEKPADGEQGSRLQRRPASERSRGSKRRPSLPTAEELRGLKSGTGSSEKAAQSDGAAGDTAKPSRTAQKPPIPPPRRMQRTSTSAPQGSSPAAAKREKAATPVISIESDVDPESWAEYGGWYRQDYAIYYRPTGHKDKFIYSWLFLTGPQGPKGDKRPGSIGLRCPYGQGRAGRLHEMPQHRRSPEQGAHHQFLAGVARDQEGKLHEVRPRAALRDHRGSRLS